MAEIARRASETRFIVILCDGPALQGQVTKSANRISGRAAALVRRVSLRARIASARLEVS